MYLVKTDSLGIMEWEHTFGGNDYDECKSVQQTTDGGYILGGLTNSFGTGEYDMYLVKTDSLGIMEWDTTFGGSDYDMCYSVQQTSEGSYILGGSTQSYGAGGVSMYLVKADSLGNMEWQTAFGGINYDICRSVQQTSDNGYILLGETYSYGVGNYDMYLVKTDSLGTMEWDTTFGGHETDYGYSVRQTTDGGFILGGTTPSFGVGMKDMYLVKTDSLGNYEWDQTFGGNGDDECHSIQQTNDGGYILGGYTNSYGAGSQYMYHVKSDSLGVMEWHQIFGGSGWDCCKSVQHTTDGGYILGGYTSSFGAGSRDMYLVKLGAGGSSLQIGVTLTPENLPIVIPDSGGSFEFNLMVSNNEITPVTFSVWSDITLPNSTIYGPVIGPRELTLLGGRSIDRDRTQDVPANAPAGMYTYNAYVGDNLGNVWDDDHFEFEKLGTGDGPIISNWDNWGDSFGTEEKSIDYRTQTPIISGSIPNPFNPTTVLSYQLPMANLVNLSIYDIAGRKVAELVNGWKNAGVHEVTFDGSGLASGVYLYRIEAGDFNAIGKMLLMK
jgi:hypothetical protein